MKNRSIGNVGQVVQDWEENILFETDSTDFCSELSESASTALAEMVLQQPPKLPASTTVNGFGLRVPTTSSTMSLASVHGPQFADICSPLGLSSISVSSSLSDLVGSPLEISVDNVVTIEELRQHLGSCFTCGVSWTDDHVSLDCSECGGYSLERPCPLCDGKCGVQWKRDFTMSHACGKARWHGVCPSYPEAAMHLAATSSANAVATAANAVTTSAVSCASAATQLRLAQELCARLEQLSAGAHT